MQSVDAGPARGASSHLRWEALAPVGPVRASVIQKKRKKKGKKEKEKEREKFKQEQ